MRKPKGPKVPNGRAAGKVERKFSLSAETVRRLEVHAAMTGERPARLIDRLVDQHVRRWVVSDRGGEGADGTPGPKLAPADTDAA